MTWIGREALPKGRLWSGGPPGGPEGVGRPSRMTWIGREALPMGRLWSGGPPEGPAVVGRPF